MKREDFKELVNSRIVFMDGATGSNLIKRGMPGGVCVEQWIVDNPEAITGLQKEYRQAGSDIILAPTFGANRPLLTKHGIDDVAGLNEKLVGISRRANPDAYIAGDVSMTGLMVEPLGDTEFEELISVYKEQIGALVNAGVDLIDIETMINLEDAKAAVVAAKEVCDLPVMVTMSYTETGRTMYGNSPVEVINALQKLGVDACGLNCSAGPDNVLPIIKELQAKANVPLIVKPNAGLPQTDKDGNTVYSMGAREFADHFEEILKYGVRIIGGCCGTTPEYIRKLHDRYGV
ncbi:MAG: homocysteine S-methyltransferase family protein [Lachnospiraceae bacterium]|nr:homocysteine S-methyltransferase family protein [Lachnospiraceae bacterium]